MPVKRSEKALRQIDRSVFEIDCTFISFSDAVPLIGYVTVHHYSLLMLIFSSKVNL